jgi:hypothetical protein
MNLDALILQLKSAKNAALLLGAGISKVWEVPPGYGLLIEFGKNNTDILREYNLYNLWKTAKESESPETQKHYTDELISTFCSSKSLQRSLLQWMNKQPSMLGYNLENTNKQPDDHLIFDIAWIKGVFQHLITTNWDFILESYLDYLYWEAYNVIPLLPTPISLNDGTVIEIDYALLFFYELLNKMETEDELTTIPRWDIIVSDIDLPRKVKDIRPLWKIHGSPFFLACPLCSGATRWKREIDNLGIGDPCPEHPDQVLEPEMVFWEEQVDHASPQVWEALQAELHAADMIVVCGFSGGDKYIRTVLESHPNTWVVNPDFNPRWNSERINYVNGTGTDLAKALLPLL